MTTWRRGRSIVTRNRQAQEGSLRDFVDDVHARGLLRVPGTAVFLHRGKDTTPLALRANTEHNQVVHETVVIVSMTAANVPYVAADDRLTYDDLGYADDGIQHLSIKFGFSDQPFLPDVLVHAHGVGMLEPRSMDVTGASYFLSRGTIRQTTEPGMARWRKTLFRAMARNAADPAAYFGLPTDRTVTMGSDVNI
jgi:KUP system potassium uptake protein